MRQESEQALIDAIEAASDVERRPQLYQWLQLHLRRFVPHELAVCAVARPATLRLAVQVFHVIPLGEPLLAALADEDGALLRALLATWNRRPDQPVRIAVDALDGAAPGETGALRAAGFDALLVHAVRRGRDGPGVESLFVFAGRGAPPADDERTLRLLHWLRPQLHLMTLRVGAGEESRVDPRSRSRSVPPGGVSLTPREREILLHARDGKRNAEIGVALGISGLTVKNHLQKILRKLGATNRAQAVAEALSRNMLGAPPVAGPAPARAAAAVRQPAAHPAAGRARVGAEASASTADSAAE